MFKAKMIENEKDFHCQNKHEQPVHLVVLDPKLDKKQRLLCNQCMENFESDAKTIGLKKIIQIIEDIVENKMINLDNITQQTVQQLEICTKRIQHLKTQFMKLFDSLINIAEDWTKDLLAQRQLKQYSFYDELDIYIHNQNNSNDSNITLINNINKSWITKLYNNLNQYIQNKDKVNFTDIKQQFTNIYSQIVSKKSEIKLKLIDQFVKQSDKCNAITFDSTGSIMVSTQQNDIIVWSFVNGTIKLIKSLQGHTDKISCLVYSKKQNSFISGAGDNTIRCWKQQNSNDWISSQSYKQHTSWVFCIILNENEDLLFSGSDDRSIKVWKVDFNLNILTYLYSLDKHDNYVTALSLNQSETQLVSCAQGKNQIIIWERREQDNMNSNILLQQMKFITFSIQDIQLINLIIVINHFIYKQSIQDYGLKVKFIKENQFIWITGGKEIDKLYIFELKEGIFQENQEKTIQLITNNQNEDEYRFPIMYNKEKNVIVVRHKTYIYIIREINDGKFKIVDSLNCENYLIFGTITNNGQYLVYWDDKNIGYSTYELLNK